jgi:Domain of unknown function (DUF3395)
MKETEWERVAREAREFRESEAKRIAAEKEEARNAMELRKQLERERIAMETGRFLKDAAKEQESKLRIKEHDKHIQREEGLRVVSGVSEKAQLLSERDCLERQRAAEERRIRETRSLQGSPYISSDSSHVETSSIMTEQGGEKVDGASLSHGSIGSIDSAPNQSFIEDSSDTADDDSTAVTKVLERRDTIYYDAVNSLSRRESTAGSAADMSLAGQPSGDEPIDNSPVITAMSSAMTTSFGAAVDQSFLERTSDMTNDDGTAVTKILKRLETVYYDTIDIPSTGESETGPASTTISAEAVTVGEHGGERLDSEALHAGSTGNSDAPADQPHFEHFSDIEGNGSTNAAKLLKKSETMHDDTTPQLLRMESTADVDSSGNPETQAGNISHNPIETTSVPAERSGEEPIQFFQDDSPALTMLFGDDHANLGRQTRTEVAGGYNDRIVKRRFQRTPRKPTARESEAEEDSSAHHGAPVACYEFPIEYSSSDGRFNIGRGAELSMSTYLAPARVDGNWSGVIEGKASLGPSALMDQADGSVTIDYAANRWSKLSFGMIRGHELFHPLITLGGSLMRHGSILGITFYHNAAFLHSMLLEHSMYSITFRHSFPKSRWVFSSEVSRRQQLSMTISNSKVFSTISWTMRKPQNATARLELRPTLGTDRAAHFFGECRSCGIWQVGASLVQSLHSSMATVGLGVRLYSTRGLEWVLSWTRGEATVRIPVLVSSGIANVHIGQVLYFGMLSFLIQEAIAEMWGWKHLDTQKPVEKREGSIPVVPKGKARHAAEVQQGLMARQAKRKLRDETDKAGLVIHEATYAVEGGDSWNVSVPLQFWVNQSSLTLPPKPKSHLLGFFDLVVNETAESSDVAEVGEQPKHSSPWWKDAWNDLMAHPLATSDRPSATALMPVPTLEVLYEFQGQRYQIQILDGEELVLPNPAAKKL